jgi:hypothetical protein
VRIEAATIPVRAAVADVKAFRGKLWVSVDISTDAGTPAARAVSESARPSSGPPR